MVQYKFKGRTMERRIVRKHGNSGHTYLPKDWIGHEVVIIVDPED